MEIIHGALAVLVGATAGLAVVLSIYGAVLLLRFLLKRGPK